MKEKFHAPDVIADVSPCSDPSSEVMVASWTFFLAVTLTGRLQR